MPDTPAPERPDTENEMENWTETARQYAENADYWRGRYERTMAARLRRFVRRFRR